MIVLTVLTPTAAIGSDAGSIEVFPDFYIYVSMAIFGLYQTLTLRGELPCIVGVLSYLRVIYISRHLISESIRVYTTTASTSTTS